MTLEADAAVQALSELDHVERLGRAFISRCGGVDAAVGRLLVLALELTDGTLTVGDAQADEWGNRWSA